MHTFLAFPGQGSQYVGMGKDLLVEFPFVADVYEEIEDHTGLAIRKLSFDDPDQCLNQTEFTQPCILAHSLVVAAVLRQESDLLDQPAVIAGHSLGEYSALVAGGLLSCEQAAKTVRVRGRCMQQACLNNPGGMTAVINFPGSDEELVDQCRLASSNAGGSVVEVANFNGPSQTILAGHIKGLEEFERRVEKPTRSKRLNVSAPFHCSLMSSVRADMEAVLDRVELGAFASAESWFVPNVTGEPTRSYQIDFLKNQIDRPVQWSNTMSALPRFGVRRVYEVGPGQVLSGLLKKSRALPAEQTQLIPLGKAEQLISYLKNPGL